MLSPGSKHFPILLSIQGFIWESLLGHWNWGWNPAPLALFSLKATYNCFSCRISQIHRLLLLEQKQLYFFFFVQSLPMDVLSSLSWQILAWIWSEIVYFIHFICSTGLVFEESLWSSLKPLTSIISEQSSSLEIPEETNGALRIHAVV